MPDLKLAEDLLIGYKDSLLKIIEGFAESNLKYKFAAHERLFRLVTNVTTVFLSGWVALITWRKGFVGDALWFIIFSWVLHILSMLLICLGDFFILLQTRIGEKALSEKRNLIFEDKHILKGKLASLVHVEDLAEVQKVILEHSEEYDKKVDKVKDQINFKRGETYGKCSWMFSVAGGAFFFIAIIFSLFSIVKYLQSVPKI